MTDGKAVWIARDPNAGPDWRWDRANRGDVLLQGLAIALSTGGSALQSTLIAGPYGVAKV